MPRAERKADVVWEGNLSRGTGTLAASTSGSIDGQTISLPTRVGDAEGKTSPEELIAAAHAGCFAMALSGELTRAETPPERLDVSCTITLDEVEEGKHSIVRSALSVRGRVPGIDEDAFRRAAEAAKEGCVVSRALTAEIELDAQLAAR